MAAFGSVSVTANTATSAGHVALADEALLAVEDPVVAVPGGLGAKLRGVRSSARFGQGKRDQLLAGCQVGDPALLLLVGAAVQERQRGQLLDAEDQPDRGRGAAQLLDRQQHGDEVAAETAVLGRKWQSQHVVLGQQLDHVPRELGLLVDLGGARGHRTVGELRDGVA